MKYKLLLSSVFSTFHGQKKSYLLLNIVASALGLTVLVTFVIIVKYVCQRLLSLFSLVEAIVFSDQIDFFKEFKNSEDPKSDFHQNFYGLILLDF